MLSRTSDGFDFRSPSFFFCAYDSVSLRRVLPTPPLAFSPFAALTTLDLVGSRGSFKNADFSYFFPFSHPPDSNPAPQGEECRFSTLLLMHLFWDVASPKIALLLLVLRSPPPLRPRGLTGHDRPCFPTRPFSLGKVWLRFPAFGVFAPPYRLPYLLYPVTTAKFFSRPLISILS